MIKTVGMAQYLHRYLLVVVGSGSARLDGQFECRCGLERTSAKEPAYSPIHHTVPSLKLARNMFIVKEISNAHDFYS